MRSFFFLIHGRSFCVWIAGLSMEDVNVGKASEK